MEQAETQVETISKAVRALREKIAARPPGMKDRPRHPHSDADEDCRRCGGWGWAQSKQFDGNWFVCQCVVNAHERAIITAQVKPDYSRMGMREDELSLTWEAVKPGFSDGIKAVQPVREAYTRGYGVIFLWGTYGQAKTLVGKILTAVALRDGKRAAYANVATVLDDIRLAFDEPERKTAELLRRMNWWISRDVLFVDELDKVNTTDWAQERMFQLLDQRYTRAIREEALTVIASNKSGSELDGYLKSRLADRRLGPVIHLNGPDARQAMPDGYKY